MEYLLGKSQHTSLTAMEQSELRRYVVAEQPGAKDVTFETLVTLGLIIVGAYLLYKFIESTA
ncbi:hypothetical protein [Methanoculleus sp.]|uniref:hypothetical protein n=1 Tax=Methanoculleus sp. TaxID=90427 RepID=UPI0025D13FF5|nr:hypothetical protein [Methanoculleus sp.]